MRDSKCSHVYRYHTAFPVWPCYRMVQLSSLCPSVPRQIRNGSSCKLKSEGNIISRTCNCKSYFRVEIKVKGQGCMGAVNLRISDALVPRICKCKALFCSRSVLNSRLITFCLICLLLNIIPTCRQRMALYKFDYYFF